eukprot:COSAG02_NODE_42_length_46522_cov_109.704478_5_plen_248_part_00
MCLPVAIRGVTGGVKVAGVSNVTFRHNKVHDNNGTGLWSDICSTHVHYIENVLVNNSGPGVSHEISLNSTIRGNIACSNGWGKPHWLWGGQLQVQNSEGVVVSNNSVVVGPTRGTNGITLVQQNRTQCADQIGLPFHAARRNVFLDNRVYYPAAWGVSGGVADFKPVDPALVMFSSEANNTWRGNTYFVSAEERTVGGGEHWEWAAQTENFSGWRRVSTVVEWATGSVLATAPPDAVLMEICSLDQP